VVIIANKYSERPSYDAFPWNISSPFALVENLDTVVLGPPVVVVIATVIVVD
jgi:hypothetical protein